MQKDGRTYRLIQDHLGSLRLVMGIATGAVAQKIAYTDLGTVIFLILRGLFSMNLMAELRRERSSL